MIFVFNSTIPLPIFASGGMSEMATDKPALVFELLGHIHKRVPIAPSTSAMKKYSY